MEAGVKVCTKCSASSKDRKFHTGANICNQCRYRKYDRQRQESRALGAEHNETTLCECSNVKAIKDRACQRCLFLDGKNKTEAEVINYLRQVGGSALGSHLFQEFAKEYSTRTEGKAPKWHFVRVSLDRLVADGRVKEVVVDEDAKLKSTFGRKPRYPLEATLYRLSDRCGNASLM